MHRLSLILAAMFAVAVSLFAEGFWREKPYTQWSQEEVDQILKDSPWAAEIAISHDGGGRSFPAMTLLWRSAMPIKQALLRKEMLAGSTSTVPDSLDRTETEYTVVLAGIPMRLAQEQESKKTKSFEVTPSGYVQLDFRAFPQWTVQPGTGSLNHERYELRRLRGGIDGRWRKLEFEVKGDPKDEDGVFLKDVYVKFPLLKSLKLRSGQFKLPGSREYLISAKNIDFIERTALATALAPGRDIGAALEGSIGKRFDYEAGIFAGDGNGRRERAGLTSAGRIEWKPVKAVTVATLFTEGRVHAVPDDASPNGIEGRMPSGYRFFDRLYVQGRRLRIGSDVEWEFGRFQITAEGLRVRDERREQGLDFEDLPSLISHAWSTGARWRFGKGRHAAVRYEWIRLDDAGPNTGRDSVRPRASDVRAKAAQGLTIGLSWKPHSLVRFMGNAGLERYAEPRSAPEAGRYGNYYTISSRIQFEWP